MPGTPVVDSDIISLVTRISSDPVIFRTTDPFGKVNSPPPVRPDPATISIFVPLRRMVPVLSGNEDICKPS